MIELPSIYNPEQTESKRYDVWMKHGLFGSQPDPKRSPFTIVIPPPNVTGSLHMGHALNNTLQDVLIRWHKMKGDNTLWIPGTDHGGIATQNVVEKMLKKEGKTRHDLGRETFLKRMWRWRQDTGDTILHQLRKIGCACDWDRTRFTMDEASSKAVMTAFVELYRRHLIYRGRRLVNWCPRCFTALADVELDYVESAGHLWHIRYPFADGSGRTLVVATTRPETMLGDTAVAVHPDDKRYADARGKTLRLPLMDREIPIVFDAAVDPAFGTGAVKVTPSHDAADFEIARRQNLPHEMVVGYDGRMTDRAGKYAGLSLKECREKVLADLTAGDFLEKEEPYKHSVATCYRCATVIEPLESSQWFMKTGDLAKRAAHATEVDRVQIFPESWEKPYIHWLTNNRDWCLSRQIWWGHRIPVWYCLRCSRLNEDQLGQIARDPTFQLESTKMILRESASDPIVREEDPVVCPRCGKEEIIQDPDVLDTWFSSALWPISTLGWPKKTQDLSYYYPTSVLVTGHEILYLWVARMVMMGEELASEVPFRHVFIHGIVRDKHGKKMSKSLNNVIDPLDIMKKFGTDALRFALISSAIPGRDMQLSDDSFVGARNFANKIWNASRFVLTNLSDHRRTGLPPDKMDLSDRWIRRRCVETLKNVDAFVEGYDLAQAARTLYSFFWGEFCDWYIELAKIRLQGLGGPAENPPPKPPTTDAALAAKETLATVLDSVLRALHPIMPFITEELWGALGETLGEKTEGCLMAAPGRVPALFDSPAASEADMRAMEVLMETVTALRTVRSEMNVPPGKSVPLLVNAQNALPFNKGLLETYGDYVKRLGKVSEIRFIGKGEKPAQAAAAVASDFELFIPLEGLIDFEKEKQRLSKEVVSLDADLQRLQARLSNPDFTARAPQEEVTKAKDRHTEVTAKKQRLQTHLAALAKD
ncbi:MAG TPA: valine--tRNA ligase [Elusimicrobiota bacterium]|nr:valine--tRNA ligase [Elusimicrobiota bacterium]